MTAPTAMSGDRLPDSYDMLLPVEQLVHGDHNPRKVSPTQELRESIRRDGIQQPLIVRPDSDQELYHVTDGWQRYQAATALGWEHLPVRIYETPLAALEATERASIVREWSSYDWAQYCQSVAAELETDSQRQLVQEVAERTVKSPKTVKRYLEALSLPDLVHPLLQSGPQGTEQQWLALQNYNQDVRRYEGFSWRVGATLGRQVDRLQETRVVSIAVHAVEYETAEQAIEFATKAAEQSEMPLKTVQQQVRWEGQHTEYLVVSRVTLKLDHQDKEALMEHCAENRTPLCEVVETQLREFVAEL